MTNPPSLVPDDGLSEDGEVDQAAAEQTTALLATQEAASLTLTVKNGDGRRRQIVASVLIPAALPPIWQVLTDYEALADFIPNLKESCVVGTQDDCPLLRQVGIQRFMRLTFAAAVTLKMEEHPPDRLRFSMVEGDFLVFEGHWHLTPQAEQSTLLTYQLDVLPPRRMPIGIVERRLKQDLAVNLLAMRQQVLQCGPTAAD